MLPVYGLYGHAQRNAFVSIALFASFAALLMLVLALFDIARAAAVVSQCADASREPACLSGLDYVTGTWSHFVGRTRLFDTGWLYALAVGFAWVAMNVWWARVIMRYETGARPVERRDAPELHAIVETLAITAGLRCPCIEIVDTDKLNAYASGFSPARATIGVTRGLLAALPRRELEAVMAHEIAHIKLRDIRLMVVAKACSDLSFLFAKVIAETVAQPVRALLALCVLVAVVGPVAAALLIVGLLIAGGWSLVFKSMISRRRELVADAAAIDLTRDAVALASALRRVAANDRMPNLSPATRAMMFSNSAAAFGTATHPSLDMRIAAIMRHALVTESDLASQHRSGSGARTVAGFCQPSEKTQTGAESKMPVWIERWALSGRADRLGKCVMKWALTALVLLPVLFLLPGFLLFLGTRI